MDTVRLNCPRLNTAGMRHTTVHMVIFGYGVPGVFYDCMQSRGDK